jgi:hypothetical protein
MEWSSMILFFIGIIFLGYYLLLTKKVCDIRSLLPDIFTRHVIIYSILISVLFVILLIATFIIMVIGFFL